MNDSRSTSSKVFESSSEPDGKPGSVSSAPSGMASGLSHSGPTLAAVAEDADAAAAFACILARYLAFAFASRERFFLALSLSLFLP